MKLMNLIFKHKHYYHIKYVYQQEQTYIGWNGRPTLEHYKTIVYECKCGKTETIKDQKYVW